MMNFSLFERREKKAKTQIYARSDAEKEWKKKKSNFMATFILTWNENKLFFKTCLFLHWEMQLFEKKNKGRNMLFEINT